MPTKIINVLQDDNFESVLRIFQETQATEVIFVLPKKHQALGTEDHFYILSEAANEQGKNVMILASNPGVNELALKYNFGVLTSAKVSPQNSALKNKKSGAQLKEVKPKKVIVNKPEPEMEVGPDAEEEPQPQEPEEDESLEAIENKVMADIVKPPLKTDDRVTVKISKKVEKPFEVEVKNQEEKLTPEPEDETDKRSVDDIESVWQRRSEEPRVAEKIKIPPIFIKKPRFNFHVPSFLNLSGKTLTWFGAGVIVLFGIIIFVSTGSANIIIKPRAHVLDMSLVVKASDKFLAVNLEDKTIPGQLFSIEKKLDQSFPATGEKEVVQKARGTLTVYNEYGTAPQILIATTRFESPGGLIFRTLKTVTVPGTRVVNGEIIAGSVTVEVIADKAGENYNIDSAKFTIPAFKEKGDNDRYQKYYGMSKDPMKGGIVGKAKVVTDQDFSKAKEEVHNKLISEIQAELKSQAAELKILDQSEPIVKDVVSTARVDEAVNEFTVTETVELQAIGFRESDLQALIADYVSKNNNLLVLPDKLSLDFKGVKFNPENKILEFTSEVKGSAYSHVDKDKIISDLIGKNEVNIKTYIKGVEGIASARVILSPFWVQKVPANTDRIKFELQYE